MNENIVLKVEGMHCGGCVRSVTNAIKRVIGVKEADVSLEKESATVEFDKEVTNLSEIRTAVEEAGYKVAA
jgi:copper chaperone